MIGKNLMKHHYLKKKFYRHYIWKILLMQITRAQKEFLNILKLEEFRRISWSVCSKWYIIVRRYIWGLSKYVSWNIWNWSCSFSYGTRFSMASSSERDQNKIRSFSQYRHVINCIKRHQRRKMSVYLLTCKS